MADDIALLARAFLDVFGFALLGADSEVVHLFVSHRGADFARHREPSAMLGGLHESLLRLRFTWHGIP